MQFCAKDQSVLVIEDLTERGFASKDWFKYKLNHQEVLLALTELAKFHACGLAYRMSLKEEIDEKYPYLGKEHALKKYEQMILITSCFCTMYNFHNFGLIFVGQCTVCLKG